MPKETRKPLDDSEGMPEPWRARMRRLTICLAVVFVLGAALRLPTFARPLLSDDEAIYATTAAAMSRGSLLYRDVVDHKPPFIYHVYQAGFAALGRYNTHGAHALVVVSVLLTAMLLFAIKRKDSSEWSGLWAAGLFLVFSTTWHDYDALAANCELFLLLPQTAAAWLLLYGLRRRCERMRFWSIQLAVGVLVGTCALFKYQGLTFLGAGAGLLIWWVLLGRLSWPRAGAAVACQVAGALVPSAAYLAWCAVAGNANATVYWFKFNFAYVGAGLTGLAALARGLRRTALVGGAAIVPYSLGIWAAIATTARVASVISHRSRSGDPVDCGESCSPSAVLGLFWLVTSAFALAAGGRFFGHYFHLVLAPLCLLAAPVFDRLWDRGKHHRVILGTLCALPACAFFLLASVARPWALALDETEPPYDEVATRIDALTGPDDRIFVWGNSPQLYVLARRPMGARFSFCNYLTGESPGTPTETGEWNADRNQWPAAWDMLFADLERRRPTLFVDAAAAGWDGYDKFPVARYPRLRAYLDSHYRREEAHAGVVLYRRLP